MSEMKMQDLENMSPEELEKLQSMIQVAQTKQKLGHKYLLYQALEQVAETCKMPDQYKGMILSLREKEPVDIIPEILKNESILRFPTLMTLAGFLPCSEINVRCGLVELFDSYVYHSDFGLIISNIVPFDADKALRNCRVHDPLVSQFYLEEFYRKLLSIMNNPISEGDSRTWIRKCADDITFILHVIAGTNIKSRFIASLQFMLPSPEVGNLNDPEYHRKLVDTLSSNGSDLLYAKRIATCFKIK